MFFFIIDIQVQKKKKKKQDFTLLNLEGSKIIGYTRSWLEWFSFF